MSLKNMEDLKLNIESLGGGIIGLESRLLRSEAYKGLKDTDSHALEMYKMLRNPPELLAFKQYLSTTERYVMPSNTKMERHLNKMLARLKVKMNERRYGKALIQVSRLCDTMEQYYNFLANVRKPV